MLQREDQHDSYHQAVFQKSMNSRGEGLKEPFREDGNDSTHEYGNSNDQVISPLQPSPVFIMAGCCIGSLAIPSFHFYEPVRIVKDNCKIRF